MPAVEVGEVEGEEGNDVGERGSLQQDYADFYFSMFCHFLEDVDVRERISLQQNCIFVFRLHIILQKKSSSSLYKGRTRCIC